MADLHNIGTPRAFGHVQGRLNMTYINPYPYGSPANKAFTTGYFEGDLEKYDPPLIIEPEPPEGDPKVA